MLESLIMVAALATGQVVYDGSVVYGQPIYQQPVCQFAFPVYAPLPVVRIAPPTYVHLVGITVRTRAERVIHYRTGWKSVPIINGYAPSIRVTNFTDGSSRIVYNYSQRTPYSKCRRPGDQPKEAVINRGRLPEPDLKPVPQREPIKPVPVKPKAPREEIQGTNDRAPDGWRPSKYDRVTIDPISPPILDKDLQRRLDQQRIGRIGPRGPERTGFGAGNEYLPLPESPLRKPSDVEDVDRVIKPSYRKNS